MTSADRIEDGRLDSRADAPETSSEPATASGASRPRARAIRPARTDIVRLLDNFLAGTQGVTLQTPIHDANKLPVLLRTRLRNAEALGKAWTAWSTDQGHRVAWGDYDGEQSALLHAHVLYIEWCLPPDEHHAGWWHCYAKRPLEWICGRGRLSPEWHAHP